LISTQQGRGTYILDLPGQEVQARLRQEGLIVLTQRYLCDAARIGATLEEARKEVEQQMQAWEDGKMNDPLDAPC
jgi:hypothetical protein